MKYILSLFILISISFADEEKKEKITIGFGPYIQSQPYKNVDDMILASPVFFYDNGIVYARWTRFGIYFLGSAGEEFSWGFSLTAQPRTNGYSPDDSPHMNGMSEKESSWEGGVAFSAGLNDSFLEIIYLHDLLDKYNSYMITFEVGHTLKFDKITFYPSVVAVYQNKGFLNYYYGVTQEESNLVHPEYSTDSDFKFEAQTYISYPITDKLSVFFNAKIDWLSNEAKNSPLIEKNYYYSGIASLIYTFNF